ncbi:MAG: hypothetical protein K0A93_03125 [Desulfuromonadaceae bacterium]|nr:hypothetical protein [Desulfuromonadaceae bacterium]
MHALLELDEYFVDKFFFAANESYDGKMGGHEAILGKYDSSGDIYLSTHCRAPG